MHNMWLKCVLIVRAGQTYGKRACSFGSARSALG
jgi:hypothetical protein